MIDGVRQTHPVFNTGCSLTVMQFFMTVIVLVYIYILLQTLSDLPVMRNTPVLGSGNGQYYTQLSDVYLVTHLSVVVQLQH